MKNEPGKEKAPNKGVILSIVLLRKLCRKGNSHLGLLSSERHGARLLIPLHPLASAGGRPQEDIVPRFSAG